MQLSVETIMPRRGIRPFEKGVTRRSDAELAEIIDSPKLKIGGAGLLSLSIVLPRAEYHEDYTDYTDDEEVYAVNEEGNIVSGQTRDLWEKGYGQLFVYIDPETTDPQEMYKKGRIDFLVWVSGDKILRGELEQGPELTATSFSLGRDEEGEKRPVLFAPNAPLEKLNISLETHVEPTLEDEN